MAIDPSPDASTLTDSDAPAPEDRLAQPVDTELPPRLPFPVVGIGASAGGLEAVSEFLAEMPSDSGIAFVLVQHLPPDRESLMVEILARRTAMTVRQVEDGMVVEQDSVYVIRPGHVLTIHEGLLRLGAQLGGPRAANRPVDDFFKSLAEEQRERAICIIMSGMGSNGSAGAQAVKAVGGLCIAQEPESAQFPSMPRHLIDTGNADYVLRPVDMPEVVMAYAGHPYAKGGREADAALILLRDKESLRDILTVLRTRTRSEFSGYKKPTLLRRIQRRMGLSRVTEMREYLKLLRQSSGEVTALSDDLLIHVTGFFRDPESWDTLRERVIVPLVAARTAQDTIRCWVTACSTGDEAYTLAMLLIEEAERVGKPLEIKVFATDMAERTLAQARAGVYPGGIEAEISAERLARFFLKEDAMYRVRPEVRERVVFAPQNVLQDPPFSRLDIATCRNLLIYLESDVQRRLLELLHFGLRDGGALFLGSSETVPTEAGMFESIDKKARIFRRVGPTRHGSVEFPIPQVLRTNAKLGMRDERPAHLRPAPLPTAAQLTQRTLLEQHLPAAVLVDRDQRIVYFQGNTRPFFNQPTGEPVRDLMTLAVEGLRPAIRVALRRVATEHATVTVRDGWLQAASGHRDRVDITASPTVGANDHLVLSFELRPDTSLPAEAGADDDRGDAGQVSEELRRVRNELQTTNEELQTTNEEMRAAAEEASSVNEELQSTNEELETSKEEMQSLNEELNTVNAQLQAKMTEHQGTSNDLASLLTSTDIAVLFLDARMRIRRFTSPMRSLLELLASDVGRPLSDFAPKFSDPDLADDARLVLERLVPVEREVSASGGRWFLRRITPYRTTDDRIDGIVVTFVDITARVQTAAKLAETARLLDLSSDAIIIRDQQNRITYWNHGAQAMFGWSSAEATGKDLQRLLRTEFELPLEQLLAHLQQNERMTGEIVQVTKEGAKRTLLCRWALDRLADGTTGSILTTATDISERKRAEEVIRDAKLAAEAANVLKDQFLATVSHELRTPLSSILLWTGWLTQQPRVADELEEGLAAIQESAKAQKQLIDDLLDISRITSGNVRLNLKNIDLAELVHEAIETVRPTAEVRGTALVANLNEPIAAIAADPDRLRQVIWNLVTNAVKFTPEGGRVEVTLSPRDRWVDLRVIDNGQGITPEFLPHVFTAFRQADGSSTRRHGGLGLGLAICRQLVSLHGGTITAESEGLEKGATFTVTLPIGNGETANGLRSTSNPSRAPAVTADSDRAPLPSLAGIRILLVEDDLNTNRVLSRILQTAGATVAAVNTGVAALEAIELSRPEILLCDIGLPEMDGRELIAAVRARDRKLEHDELPAVALSAFAREEDVQNAEKAGFHCYLRKPVEPKQLLSALRKCLDESVAS